ncbi:MAG: hypothetical protein N3D11_02235 [Candidatus Sumerlaeia bacterium]|nr:hypothetical protein [Candidatus Sumerlaeia bacterium]
MAIEWGRSPYGISSIPGDERLDLGRREADLVEFLREAARGQTGGGLIGGMRGCGKSELIRSALAGPLCDDPSAVFFSYCLQPYQLDLFDLARSCFNTWLGQFRLADEGAEADLQACMDAWHSDAPQCARCRRAALREICKAAGRAWNRRDAIELLTFLVHFPDYMTEILGDRCCVMIFDNARYLPSVHVENRPVPLLRHLVARLESPTAPVFLCDSPVALRNLLGPQSASEHLAVHEIRPLDAHEALAAFQHLCDQLGVPMSVRPVERSLPQLGGLPLYLHNVARRASLSETALDSTARFGEVYAQEIREGAIHWYWRAQFSVQFPEPAGRQKAVELCARLAEAHPQRIAGEDLEKKIGLDRRQLQTMAGTLQLLGAVEQSFGTFGLTDDPVLRDVAAVLAWEDSATLSNAEVLRRLAARRVQCAATPPLEAAVSEFLARLQPLLEAFRGQYVPAEWFHYHEDYAPVVANGQRNGVGSSATMVRLPFITAVARVHPDLPANGEGIREKCIIFSARGFRDPQMTPGNETQWMVVVWPASGTLGVDEVVQSLELRNCLEAQSGLPVRHVWLIARGRLTRAARQMCAQSRLFSGNMDMVQFLAAQILSADSPWRGAENGPPALPDKIVVNANCGESGPIQVELTLTVGGAPEQAAAEAVGEVARAAGLMPLQTARMKLAVRQAVLYLAEASDDAADTIRLRCAALPTGVEAVIAGRPSKAKLGESAVGFAAAQQRLKNLSQFSDAMNIRSMQNETEIVLFCRREGAGDRAQADGSE